MKINQVSVTNLFAAALFDKYGSYYLIDDKESKSIPLIKTDVVVQHDGTVNAVWTLHVSDKEDNIIAVVSSGTDELTRKGEYYLKVNIYGKRPQEAKLYFHLNAPVYEVLIKLHHLFITVTNGAASQFFEVILSFMENLRETLDSPDTFDVYLFTDVTIKDVSPTWLDTPISVTLSLMEVKHPIYGNLRPWLNISLLLPYLHHEAKDNQMSIKVTRSYQLMDDSVSYLVYKVENTHCETHYIPDIVKMIFIG